MVTLCNSKVAKRLIAAKISMKKFTTAQLLPDRMQATKMSLPSTPSAININEYMPKEVYDIRRHVYKTSKDKKNNFITFMHEGCIYVRFKNEKPSSPIYSSEDLETFLERRAERN